MDWDEYYDDEDRSYEIRNLADMSYSDDPYDLDLRNEYSDYGFDSYEEDEDEEWW